MKFTWNWSNNSGDMLIFRGVYVGRKGHPRPKKQLPQGHCPCRKLIGTMIWHLPELNFPTLDPSKNFRGTFPTDLLSNDWAIRYTQVSERGPFVRWVHERWFLVNPFCCLRVKLLGSENWCHLGGRWFHQQISWKTTHQKPGIAWDPDSKFAPEIYGFLKRMQDCLPLSTNLRVRKC